MIEARKYCVYKHTSPNDKVYIGLTQQEPEKRWQNGKGYFQNDYFSKSINKYGWKNFDSEILYEGLTQAEASLMERQLIKKYKSDNRMYGFNHTDGGESGYVYNEVSNAKSSETITKRYRSDNPPANTRLSVELAKEIRERYQSDLETTHRGLAKEYGVSNITIQQVVSNKTWHDKNYVDKRNGNSKKRWSGSFDVATEIREFYKVGNKSISEIAILYEASVMTIKNIIYNKVWVDTNYLAPKRPKGRKKVLSNQDVVDIRDKYNGSDITMTSLAEKYGVSKYYIRDILNNKERIDKNYQRTRTYGNKGRDLL